MRNYTIYFITLILGVAIFYTFNSMDSQAAMLTLSKSKQQIIQSMVQLLSVISVIVSIILGYLIVYANNFLIRRRKKEFGLYQTLGMSKGKIARMLLIETICIGIVSLIIGVFLGIFLSQAMSVLIIQMFQADMSAYQFNFSRSAVLKSGLYFGVIYLLVMVFNVFTVSRYKLIDLLTASKKNEVLRLKNTIVSVVMFVASLVCIGAAYYMLRVRHVLLQDVRESVIMIVLGTIGTYLLFSSLAGFLLKLVQTRKGAYYRNLNMFVLRQVNSRVNTMKVSMTIISIMLLLTIGILSSALSLVSAFNSDLKATNRCDITLLGSQKEDTNMLSAMKKQGYDYTKQFKDIMEYVEYRPKDENANLEQLLGKDTVANLEEEYNGMISLKNSRFFVMKESSYNRLMELYGETPIALKSGQYALVANFDRMVPFYNEQLKKNRTITIEDKTLSPYSSECIDMPLQNTNLKSELGMLVLPDVVIESGEYEVEEHRVCGTYKAGDAEALEAEFEQEIAPFTKGETPLVEVEFTKIQMGNSKAGTTAVFTFIGLYLGIIFSITSAAILAIGQLSESADNKERYAILRKIGVDDKMINHSLLLQIGIYFILPLGVAVIHSFVGIREVAGLISIFGNMELDKNIALTALFLVFIYGAYFIATYMGSKGIIKEKEKYVG